MLRKAVFLDRDGVINRDSPDYIKRLEEFEFLPGSLDALRRLAQRGFACIVITNQSAPARGLMTFEALDAIHRRLCAAVAEAGGRILDIFICPHLPADGCSCRKPKPGLLHAAQRKYGIDFSSAAMIGDSVTDIECALNAGVRTTVDADAAFKLGSVAVVGWPFERRADAERARAMLAARGLRVDLVEF